MAKIGRRSVMFLLISICLTSILLRYPLVSHPRQNDTSLMYVLANSISAKGYAAWTFSFFSYFGLYPASYPSGMMFLLSEVSGTTGLPLTCVTLVANLVVGVIGVLGVFVLGRIFLHQSEYAALASFFAALSPRFVDMSYLSASARSPFVVLAVLVLFCVFRAGKKRNHIYYALSAFLLVGCLAMHHMGVLFLLFGVAYTLGVVGNVILARARFSSHLGGYFRKLGGAYVAALATFTVLMSVFFFEYFERELKYSYGTSPMFSFKPELVSMTLSVAASYTNQVGIILVVAILGIPLMLLRSALRTETLFLMVLPIVFVPLLPNSAYLTVILSPVFAVLGTAILGLTMRGKRRRQALAFVCALVIASAIMPFATINRWNELRDSSGDTLVIDDQVVNDAAYVRWYREDAFLISNVELVSSRISALSGVLYLGSNIEATLTGDIVRESIKGNVTFKNEKFPRNLYTWFESDQVPNVQLNVMLLFINGCKYSAGSYDTTSDGRQYFDSHSRLLVAVDSDWPSNYVWRWGVFNARLPAELSNAEWFPPYDSAPISISSWCIYKSGGLHLYLFEVPTSDQFR